MSRQRIWGADRLVLYLPAATQALASIDGSRENEITNAAEKFLDSPETAWDKRREGYIYQIRDLGTSTRAFATWCQNPEIECEAFVVMEIYRKRNEDDYWGDKREYAREAQQYQEQFADFSRAEYDQWVEALPEREDHRVVVGE